VATLRTIAPPRHKVPQPHAGETPERLKVRFRSFPEAHLNARLVATRSSKPSR
jgi:hypothetical protein